jgi:UDP-N-acetyl-D-mannosaminuronic acid dehydrogenase
LFESVCVVGLGYIGLPTAVAIATQGISVIGVDVNPDTVSAINAGRAPFVEPDLAVALRGAVTMGRLRAVAEPVPADAFILAVPTPFANDHLPDLSFVRSAAVAIAPVLEAGNLVILESTSPPGTTLELAGWLGDLRPDLRIPDGPDGPYDVFVAHCPERVLPGRIMVEIVTNDRVVGGIGVHCAERAATLYRTFCQGECLLTDATTAELVKLAENSYRDVNIAFANELSLICDRLGIDVHRAMDLANRHPRVAILQPGAGVGGHCIAVDPWFLVSAAPDLSRLIRTAREVNDDKPKHVVREIGEAVGLAANPVVACLGLAFKANVDDLRESPAVEIVEALASDERISELLIVEPHIPAIPHRLEMYPKVELTELNDALRRADIVVVLVGHDAFGAAPPPAMRGSAIIDACGAWRSRPDSLKAGHSGWAST